jgi:site-specific recombinase XerD
VCSQNVEQGFIMKKLKFYQPKNYSSKTMKKPIYISFYLEREKVVIPLGITLEQADFDFNKGLVVPGVKNSSDLNLIISNIRARINDVMVKYRLRNRVLTKREFIREFHRPSDFATFFEYFKYYTKTHKYEIESTTVQSHKVIINKLEDYRPTLHFDDITERFIKEYSKFLKVKLRNKTSTINKNLAVIKKYIRAAIKDGYMLDNPFENIKISRKTQSPQVYLTEEELTTLVHLYQSRTLHSSYQEVLRFFLFLCFSSLHIGDAKALRVEQIGEKQFTYYRAKLRNSKPEPIIIPLSKPCKAILKDVIGNRKRGPLFEHMIADQKVNEYLKNIAKSAGIDKALSSKSGRHTFATIFLRKTKDLATLQTILGHSDLRETRVYAHVVNDSLIDGIHQFDSFKI